MSREDVIINIMSNYGKYGVTLEWLEESIRGGEQKGFSYQTIYTGLRMALSSNTDHEELLSVGDIAEALGVTEEEIIQQIEELRGEMKAGGIDTDQYFKRIEPWRIQRFIIPPGGLLS
ncbi:hypothetical protein AALB39_24610 [Lachnospiraceae bacterium 54-53]